MVLPNTRTATTSRPSSCQPRQSSGRRPFCPSVAATAGVTSVLFWMSFILSRRPPKTRIAEAVFFGESGMPEKFGTAAYWFERAAEANAVAEQMQHDDVKRAMENVAA